MTHQCCPREAVGGEGEREVANLTLTRQKRWLPLLRRRAAEGL